MSVYRCEICGTVLEGRPARRISSLQPDGFWEDGFDFSCPICAAPEQYVRPCCLYGEEEAHAKPV